MPTVRESPMKSASSKYEASTVVNCSGVGSGVGVGSAVSSGAAVTAAAGCLPTLLRSIRPRMNGAAAMAGHQQQNEKILRFDAFHASMLLESGST